MRPFPRVHVDYINTRDITRLKCSGTPMSFNWMNLTGPVM